MRLGQEPHHDQRQYSTRRLEAFTDGVFAIAATLLVLDLSVDKLGDITTNPELWSALAGMGPTILSFAISFGLLCLLWATHTSQFEFIVHSDGPLVVLNSIRLLGVVLIPFTTSLNSEYSELFAGRILMPLNFFIVVLVGVIQWQYATSKPRLTARLDAQLISETRRGGLIAVVVSGLVVIAAAWFGPIAFLLFILNFIADRIVSGRRKTSRRGTTQGTGVGDPEA